MSKFAPNCSFPRRAKPAAGGFPRKMRLHFAWGPEEGWGGVDGISFVSDGWFVYFGFLVCLAWVFKEAALVGLLPPP